MSGKASSRKEAAEKEQEQPFRDLGEATYRVTLPVFEGPLDLLLHLVQKHELSITELPVSFVTEKYLEYLALMKELQIDIASEYLVMAATLAHLKSKTLLPPDPRQDGDDGDSLEELDPREELIRRLLQYQKYKDAAEKLGAREVAGRDVFVRPPVPVQASGDGPLAEFSVFKLIEAFQSVLSNAKVKIQHEVTADRITITERIHELVEVMRLRPRMLFEEIFDGATTRFDYVITFLAMLEMTRLRMTRVYQSEPYAPIHIELAVTDEEGLAAARARLPQS
ncbi:MAG: segregation/condensation protein A [Deltaproteobacteria bacterium]|nr:segregation/condensation protein A [Deltaproteobacteria bacterium]